MKKLFRFLFVLFIIITAQQTIFSQITKQDAIDLVVNTLYASYIDSVSIFMDSTLQTSNYYKPDPYDSIQSSYNEYWLFFIDKQPWNLAWSHECSYVFVNKMNGNYLEIESQNAPFHYYKLMEHVSVTFEFSGSYPDFSGGPLSPTYPSDNPHLYAILFGISGSGIGGSEIWNNFSHIFTALKNKGFPDENIYILFDDGVPLGDSTSFPSLDLNNDLNNDIIENVVCNVNNLDSLFKNVLKEELDVDDLLFMYSYTHGTAGDTNETYLELWLDERMYDTTLARMVEEVNCSELIYVIEACHGGGVIDNFKGNHQTIISCVDWETSIVNFSPHIEQLGFTPYTYSDGVALRGEHPKDKDYPWLSDYTIGNRPELDTIGAFGGVEDFNPDLPNYGNNDGVIQINEAILYGKTLFIQFDSAGQNIYNSGFQETDDLLCLKGISGKIDTTQTVAGNFVAFPKNRTVKN